MRDDQVEQRRQVLALVVLEVLDRPALAGGGEQGREIELLVVRAERGEQIEDLIVRLVRRASGRSTC